MSWIISVSLILLQELYNNMGTITLLGMVLRNYFDSVQLLKELSHVIMTILKEGSFSLRCKVYIL